MSFNQEANEDNSCQKDTYTIENVYKELFSKKYPDIDITTHKDEYDNLRGQMKKYFAKLCKLFNINHNKLVTPKGYQLTLKQKDFFVKYIGEYTKPFMQEIRKGKIPKDESGNITDEFREFIENIQELLTASGSSARPYAPFLESELIEFQETIKKCIAQNIDNSLSYNINTPGMDQITLLKWLNDLTAHITISISIIMTKIRCIEDFEAIELDDNDSSYMSMFEYSLEQYVTDLFQDDMDDIPAIKELRKEKNIAQKCQCNDNAKKIREIDMKLSKLQKIVIQKYINIIKGIIQTNGKATSEEVLHAALQIDKIHRALCGIKNPSRENAL